MWYNHFTMTPRREYIEGASVPQEVNEALASFSPLARILFYRRGITDELTAERFLNPDYEKHLHDPFLLTDMEKATARVLLAMRNNEHIVIYSDYDCDGIPGGVVLHDFFEAIGYTNFENYIPHRHFEGYGFNVDAVDKLKQRETSLIITVDCGIVDHEATKRANELSIDVIITDHHEPSASLPPAYAVVNPKRDDAYPFKGLCGAGVAYKLALAILTRGRASGKITLKEGMEKWWLDMVGLATIADMVPLQGENRIFAHYGLAVLRKSPRPGIQQLLRKAGSSQHHLTEDDIGFTIAPRINAASRMDTPEDAFHMLRTKDEGEAGAHVAHLETLNNERKGVVAAMTKEAKHRLHLLPEMPSIIVMGNPEWKPSLVGLVAGSLATEYVRPVFLWGRDGKGIIKGSCRSGGTMSTLRLMEHASDAFLGFGGHHVSGGFSVADDKIHILADALAESYTHLGETPNEADLLTVIDANLTLADINHSFMRMLVSFAPFGEGNQKPLFRFASVLPDRVEIFGKAKNHTKLRFTTEHGMLDAIAFFRTPEQFGVVPEAGVALTLIAHVEESYFMGRKEIRLRIVDIV